MTEQKKDMSVSEAGRLGGQKVHEKYGREFYQMIGAKGGERTSARYGSGYYREIGKKGGESLKRSRATAGDPSAHEHFVEVGKKGGARVKELLAQGRSAEAQKGSTKTPDGE